jgi:hypothetical protein
MRGAVGVALRRGAGEGCSLVATSSRRRRAEQRRGSWRTCCGVAGLNAITRPAAEPLLHVDALLDGRRGVVLPHQARSRFDLPSTARAGLGPVEAQLPAAPDGPVRAERGPGLRLPGGEDAGSGPGAPAPPAGPRVSGPRLSMEGFQGHPARSGDARWCTRTTAWSTRRLGRWSRTCSTSRRRARDLPPPEALRQGPGLQSRYEFGQPEGRQELGFPGHRPSKGRWTRARCSPSSTVGLGPGDTAADVDVGAGAPRRCLTGLAN